MLSYITSVGCRFSLIFAIITFFILSLKSNENRPLIVSPSSRKMWPGPETAPSLCGLARLERDCRAAGRESGPPSGGQTRHY